MKKALITGGAGFIGSNLCEFLLKKKYKVNVIDDLSSGNKANLPTSYWKEKEAKFHTFTAQIINEKKHQPKVWSRNDPASMDLWMTAGPPSTAMRTAMQGRPDPGFPNQINSKGK